MDPPWLRSSHRLGDRLDASVQGGGLWGWSTKDGSAQLPAAWLVVNNG